MTLEQAIAILVEMDVAHWGEGERQASLRLHRRRDRQSVGLAVNTIASRVEVHEGAAWLAPALALHSAAEWRKLANSLLTSDDRYELRKGG